MESNKHSFKEGDVDGLIADYGRKPSQEIRDKTLDHLKDQREKFRRLEEHRAQKQERSQGRSF